MDSGWRTPAGSRRRVMVVADPSREASGALEWALHHAVAEHDELLLLHLEPPGESAPPRRSASAPSTFTLFLRRPPSLVSLGVPAHGSGGGGAKVEPVFLEAMRAKCEVAQPKVKVQIERVEMEGMGKATAILARAQLLCVDLLVIGQRRSSVAFLGFDRCLKWVWASLLCHNQIFSCCVKNTEGGARCKISGSLSSKGINTAEYLIQNSHCLCVGVQKKGQNTGYLLNTKTHRNFWLLA
ncbi:uncharacterized protein LOC141846781 isoform X1 [Curcuma longa]|uniref:uncharacterized protein LOC141846781 isoform X1 n=1 Tax=Curcuma longa TaxID=136217 RepID=UPI003D9F9CC1